MNSGSAGDFDTWVERILEHCGEHIVMATPLGLGKPNRLINAVYRRIANDPSRRLTIHSALSLDIPAAGQGLQQRFAAPFIKRQFGDDYPRLDYVAAMRDGRLPPNIRVHEFYFQSGAMLGSRQAQSDYVSLNYTFVARDLVKEGVNLIVQLVARRGEGSAARCSLSCNPDLTLDLLDCLAAAGQARPLMVGVVHPDLPFLGGDADVAPSMFDLLIDQTTPQQRLFALPRDAVGAAEYAIGMHASSLVRDGGTLQIGIGALSDAIVYALLQREQNNAAYRDALAELRGPLAVADGAEVIGGLDPFASGLYGSSEMLMDGFMHLRRAGILRRRVYDDLALQRALDAGVIGETLAQGDAQRLRDCGVLPMRLDAAQLPRLIRLGILPEGVTADEHAIRWPDGFRIGIEIADEDTLSALDRRIQGRQLRGGRYLQAGFCLGSRVLYDWLAGLQDEDYDGLDMGRISHINRLKRGDEVLATMQRRDARFFNTCMIASALGAAASDALEDGRVVSGVGGQYNFVAMAHELDDARSILMLRSTRLAHSKLSSNIRWNYGHTTIPRHLRDIFVTEYGIADLRGKTDEECVMAMLAISDAQFHEELVAEAIRARKLPPDFQIPESWSANTADALQARLQKARGQGMFPGYPFGSDFDALELRLLKALSWLKKASVTPSAWPGLIVGVLSRQQKDVEALACLGLDRPVSMREKLLARVVCAALAQTKRKQ